MLMHRREQTTDAIKLNPKTGQVIGFVWTLVLKGKNLMLLEVRGSQNMKKRCDIEIDV